MQETGDPTFATRLGVPRSTVAGWLRRAPRPVTTAIEAWWRRLKHQWLSLHPLDSPARVRSLVEFHVAEHNSRLPRSAFHGQTPDETYFGSGVGVPDRLAAEREVARIERLAANRARECAVCA